MTSQSSGAKMSRRFGQFSTDPKHDKAASLFDSIFPKQLTSNSENRSLSEAPPKKSNEKKVELPSETKSNSPSSTAFSSPSASIPDIAPEKCSDSDEEDAEASHASQSSSCSLNISMGRTSLSEHNNDDSGNSHKRRQNNISIIFEQEDEDSTGEDACISPPQIKRTRSHDNEQGSSDQQGLEEDKKLDDGANKDHKPVYKHRWAFDDEDDDDATTAKDNAIGNEEKADQKKTLESGGGQRTLLRPKLECGDRTRVSNVKQAHECLESGEHADYRHDIDYVLGTLLDPASSTNVKCLSVVTLAKKCVHAEFRQFFRTQNLFHRTIRALTDSPICASVAISVSSVVYLMARDKVCVSLDATALRLLSQMLKMDRPNNNEQYTKYSKMIWDVLEEWLAKTTAGVETDVKFDFTESTLSPSLLVLESLVYICTRNSNDHNLKNEMLNLGVLQWIVSKVDKTVLRLLHEKLDEAETLLCLSTLERCFWILETCTVYNKKNQAYLISHRSSVLIQSCGRLMALCHESVSRLADKESPVVKSHITCLCRISGILTNLSHENELCSTKLGQMNSFLPLCLSAFTYLAPRFAPDNKRFDLSVLMSSLLVNLVERCNANRRKVIDLVVPVYNIDSSTVSQQPTLVALTQVFLMHESAARTVDEELDRDLILEDAPTEDDTEDDNNDDEDDGRLHRLPSELTEDEMIATVQRAMNKASVHMEDSVMASYTALLIGCLMQQNEEMAAKVKSLMPDKKLTSMVEQLQRFLDFMKISNIRSSGNRSIERIIDLLDQLNG